MEVKNYFATDTQGNVLGSAQVYLYLAGTTTLATGLQNISGAALGNPFTSDANGLVQFQAPDNNYDLRVVKPGREFTIRIQCFDGIAFASMQLFDQGGAGSVKRTFQEKLSDELVSVTDFFKGAQQDHTAFFSRAAKAAPAGMNITGSRGSGGIPRAPMAHVMVPAGSYRLTELVDTANKDVTWVLHPAAIIEGYEFLNGNVFREGQRYTGQACGSVDYACGYSVRMNNPEIDAIAEVTGVPTQAGFGRYGDRDTVGLYVDNTSIPATVSAQTATYTSTSASIPAQSANTIKKLRVGMFIDTLHTPYRYVGLLKSWSTDGSTLYVDGWYLVNNVVNPASTPPDGQGLKVNAYTKIWAHNANIYLNADGEAEGGTGMEIGVFNFKGDSTASIANKTNRTWGFDAVQLGSNSYRNQVGHVTRGKWVYGCASYGDVLYPFAHFDESNFLSFRVDSGGSLELGKNGNGVAGTPYIDWHSSGLQNDYDVRCIVSGGSSANGQGSIKFAASLFEVNNLSPSANAAYSLGDTSHYWQSGYFASINVSLANIDNIELGGNSVTAVSTRVIDARTSGNSNDYDSRFEFSGGSTTTGAGATILRAASFDFSGIFRPITDLGMAIGQTLRRVSNVFAQNLRPGAGAVVWTSGVGSPEGVLSAPRGSIYTQTDGSGLCTWYKDSGNGVSGWVNR